MGGNATRRAREQAFIAAIGAARCDLDHTVVMALHPFIGGAGTLAAIGRKAIANNRGDDV